MRLFFVTPVWGVNHLGLFLEIGLPSLFAPGNLPSLAEPGTCGYLIYTRRADEREAATVFVPPDCVWGNCSIAQVQRIANCGKSLIHISGIRLDCVSVVPELRRHLSDDRCVLDIEAR